MAICWNHCIFFLKLQLGRSASIKFSSYFLSCQISILFKQIKECGSIGFFCWKKLIKLTKTKMHYGVPWWSTDNDWRAWSSGQVCCGSCWVKLMHILDSENISIPSPVMHRITEWSGHILIIFPHKYRCQPQRLIIWFCCIFWLLYPWTWTYLTCNEHW